MTTKKYEEKDLEKAQYLLENAYVDPESISLEELAEKIAGSRVKGNSQTHAGHDRNLVAKIHEPGEDVESEQ